MCVALLAALDDLPITKSKKLWLCALSRAENIDMKWDEARRTVGKNWGTGPAQVLGVKAEISLPGQPTWKVQALDPKGNPTATLAEKTNRFTTSPEHKTVWWLMTRE
jgi:hypothetical protein